MASPQTSSFSKLKAPCSDRPSTLNPQPSTRLPRPALVVPSGLVLDEHRPVEPAAGVALVADVEAEGAVERAVRRAAAPLGDVEVARPRRLGRLLHQGRSTC